MGKPLLLSAISVGGWLSLVCIGVGLDFSVTRLAFHTPGTSGAASGKQLPPCSQCGAQGTGAFLSSSLALVLSAGPCLPVPHRRPSSPHCLYVVPGLWWRQWDSPSTWSSLRLRLVFWGLGAGVSLLPPPVASIRSSWSVVGGLGLERVPASPLEAGGFCFDSSLGGGLQELEGLLPLPGGAGSLHSFSRATGSMSWSQGWEGLLLLIQQFKAFALDAKKSPRNGQGFAAVCCWGNLSLISFPALILLKNIWQNTACK